MENTIINILEKIVGTDKIEFISGEILDVGTKTAGYLMDEAVFMALLLR